jgi:hypothetical protein
VTTLAATGHRPWAPRNPGGLTDQQLIWARARCQAGLIWLREHGLTEVWSGMAMGWDLIVADVAHQVGLPFIAHIPYKSQPIGWPVHWQGEWFRLRALARDEKVYGDNPTDRETSIALLKARNEGLVQADALFACWNGVRRGGTWSAIAMAQRLGKPGVLLDPVKRETRIVKPGEWF